MLSRFDQRGNVKRFYLFLTILLWMSLGLVVGAQQTTVAAPIDAGILPTNSYLQDDETIALSSGNVVFTIPLVHLKGRAGHDLIYNAYINSVTSQVLQFTYQAPVAGSGQPPNVTYWGAYWSPTVVTGGSSIPSAFSNRMPYPGVQPLGYVNCNYNPQLTLPDGSSYTFSSAIFNCTFPSGAPYGGPTLKPIVLDDQNAGIVFDGTDPTRLVFAMPDGSMIISQPSINTLQDVDKNGNVITYVSNYSVSPATITITDTVGRHVTVSGNTVSGNTVTYPGPSGAMETIISGSGKLSSTSICYLNSFNPGNDAQNVGPKTSNPVGSDSYSYIKLPNGLTYTFRYDACGEVTLVTYPTGGYTRYAYSGSQYQKAYFFGNPPSPAPPSLIGDAHVITEKDKCTDAVVAPGMTMPPDPSTLVCPSGEAKTTFVPTIPVGSGSIGTMAVTTPDGVTTTHSFYTTGQTPAPNGNGTGGCCFTLPSEYETDVTAGGAVLRKTTTTFASSTPSTRFFGYPTGHPQSRTVTLEDGSTESQEQWDWQQTVMYDSSGNALSSNGLDGNIWDIKEHREYDWGSGGNGLLIRSTDTTWNAPSYSGGPGYAAHQELSETIYATPSKTLAAQTSFEYDNYSHVNGGLTASGAIQHGGAVIGSTTYSYGTSFTARHNLTGVGKWRNTDGAWLYSYSNFDDAGNAILSQDPATHTAHYYFTDSWADATCGHAGTSAAYQTSMTDALGHSSSASYNSCTGTLASQTDVNAQTTFYGYDLLNRLASVTYPDGGSRLSCFSDTGGGLCSALPALPLTKISSTAMSSSQSQNVVQGIVTDGTGRTIDSQVTSDPAGTVHVTSTFDNMGRLYCTSNPYRAATSYPSSCTYYDSLGRVQTIVDADGVSKSGFSYNLNQTTITDEVGNPTTQTKDARSRLTKVVEPGSLETDYTYDGLDNLSSVVQEGVAAKDTPVTRSFLYNSLSQLQWSDNPENGFICYGTLGSSGGIPSASNCNANGYDLDGNLSAKTDARGITTTYKYDALNRLSSKTYSGANSAASAIAVATFPVTYTYDSSTVANGIGRLSTEYTGSAAAPVSLTSIKLYDQMGRVKSQSTIAPNVSSTASATYDLAGDLAYITYPDGRTVQNTFDTSGRMNAVNYVNWNGSATNPPQSYFSENKGYDPAGHLMSAAFGNGVPYSAGYDNRERMTGLAYGPTSAPLWSKQFAWTVNSNLQSQTDLITGVQRQFGYDNLNRLTAAQDIYSNLAVASGSNDNTTSTSSSGSGAEETPGATGAIPQWTNPDDSNILPTFGEPNANWQGTGVTLNTVTAPDGTLTGATLAAGSSPSGIVESGFVPDPDIYANETIGGSVWLRATTPTAMNVYLIAAGTANGGVVASTQAQLTTSWQQVSVRGLMQGTPTGLSLQIGGGSAAVIGQNVYMWNPMVEDEGDAGTSVTNYLPYSQRFTAPSWQTTSAYVTDNAVAAPDQSMTGASLTGNLLTNSVQNPAPFDGLQVTASVWLQASTPQQVVLGLIETNTSGTQSTIQSQTVSVTATWTRFQVTGTAASALSKLSLQIGGNPTIAANTPVNVWGAQMELASSVGPYVGTDAAPVTASTNLTNILQYSQQPNGPTWGSTYQFSGVPDVVAAPDGSMTGYQATATGTTGWLTNDVSNPSLYDNATLTASVYLRVPSGSQTVPIYIIGVNPSGWGVLFQTLNAALTTTWQRFAVTGQAQGGMTRIYLQIGDTPTVGQVIDVWGSQMEIASHAGPYVATTALPIITGSLPTNILPNSQTLSGANWAPFNSATTVTPNYAVAPDGTTTAALLQASSTSADSGIKASVPNPSLYDGETVTASVYLRSVSGTQYVNLYLQNIGTTGSTAAASSYVAASTTWKRFDLTATLENGNRSISLQIGGAGTIKLGQSVEIWGAQFVIGSAPDPYTPTPSSTTVYATGQPGTLVQTGLNQSYSYDSFGNILQNGSFSTSYTANNQMFGYAYDASGNLLSDGMNVMTWDAESRMSTVAGATYIYDAEGNRVENQGSTVADTVYFGGRPIARYSGGQWTDLIYGPNGLLAEVPGQQNGPPVYRVTDNLGTNVGSLLANGSFVEPVDHTPFGQVFTGNTSDPYLFTGKERDAESGLDYFGARYYASNMGRFMSPDWAAKAEPVPYSKLDNPQTLNLYSYVQNNPLSKVDDNGHSGRICGNNGFWNTCTEVGPDAFKKATQDDNSQNIPAQQQPLRTSGIPRDASQIAPPEATSGTLTINTTTGGSGPSSAIDGHAWLVFTTDGGITYTYGTYGNDAGAQHVHGVNQDTELDVTATASRSAHITAEQARTFGGFVSDMIKQGSNAWSNTWPCSGFASVGWNLTTREHLDPTQGGILNNPANLENAINSANAGH